jgi:hypothetical protein
MFTMMYALFRLYLADGICLVLDVEQYARGRISDVVILSFEHQVYKSRNINFLPLQRVTAV